MTSNTFEQTILPAECTIQTINDGANTIQTVSPENCLEPLSSSQALTTAAPAPSASQPADVPIGPLPAVFIGQPELPTMSTRPTVDTIQTDTSVTNGLLLIMLLALFAVIFLVARRRRRKEESS